MSKPLFALSILFLFTFSHPTLINAAAGPTDKQGAGPNTVIATVGGSNLTLSDLQEKSGGSLFQANNTYYQAERKALDQLIDDYLLQRAARRENLSLEQLIEKHVTSTLPKDPSEEALHVYYEGLDSTQPFEEVRGQILEHVREVRSAKAKANYLQSLRGDANVVVRLAPPRADVDLHDTPMRGSRNATVTIVEFADYECPYCQQVHPELKKLEAKYPDRLILAFKDTPLPMHSKAQKAAEGAHCAGLQGKFWEYHDMLFDTKQLDPTELKQDARKLGLDGAVFDKCLDSGEEAGMVKAQLEQAQKLGLSGTPSFFINGRFLSGAVTYDALREVVEQELTGEAAKQTASR